MIPNVGVHRKIGVLSGSFSIYEKYHNLKDCGPSKFILPHLLKSPHIVRANDI
jgi:hypothetical protein